MGYNIAKYQIEDGVTEGRWYNDLGEFIGDGLTHMEGVDDAAYVTMNGTELQKYMWRTPTASDYQSLFDSANFTWEETEYNGVQGLKVTSKAEGYEGNWLFFPASDSEIVYWTSTLGNKTQQAQSFTFLKNTPILKDADRCLGLPVRAIFK